MWNFLFLCLQTSQIIPALSPELAPTSLDEAQEGGEEESQEMCCPLWKGSRWPPEGLALGMIQAGTWNSWPGNPGNGILKGFSGVPEASVQLGARRDKSCKVLHCPLMANGGRGVPTAWEGWEWGVRRSTGRL